MKKLIALIVLAFAANAFADTETVGDYTWTYRIVGDGAEIYAGEYESAIDPYPRDDIEIPATLGGKPVTAIGEYAFWFCSAVSGVTIPASVTRIGDHAFDNCQNLQSIVIPDTVTSIGEYAFSSCYSLERVDIPEGTERIESGAFMYCSGLVSVTIPDSVKFVGHGAFDICNASLYDTTTKPGLRLVDGWVVDCDEELAGVLDLTGVRGVATLAFSNCRELTAVTIPAELKGIGDMSFSGCASLQRVDITDLAAWCGIWFEDRSANPLNYAGNLYLNGSRVTELEIPDGVESIGNYAFVRYDMTSVNLPGSVKRIGDGAFFGCNQLTGIDILDSVESIGKDAFYDCDGLVRVKFGNGLKRIGDNAFCSCGALAELTIPGSVESIGDYAFDGCYGITSLTFGNGLKSIGECAFRQCNCLYALDIPDSVEYIGGSAFDECISVSRLTIGSGMARMDDCAFSRCYNLRRITFKGNAPDLGSDVFLDCDSECRVDVSRDSTGWDVDIPGVWNGLPIIYSEDIQTYTIHYRRNDGSNFTSGPNAGLPYYEEQTVECNEEVTLPDYDALGWTRRRGMTFIGWARTQEASKMRSVWKTAGEAIAAGAFGNGEVLDLYAVWKLNADAYAIVFIRNEGSGFLRTVGYNRGKKAKIPSINGLEWARRGFIFKGWAKTTADARNGVVWLTDAQEILNLLPANKTSISVYAVWEIKPTYYALKFNKNDGSGAWRSVGYEYGVNTILPTIAAGLRWSRPGYTFKGWATSKANADAGKVWKKDRGTVATGIPAGTQKDIYAIWVPTSGSEVSTPTATAIAPVLLPAGHYSGMLADGTGTYDLIADAGLTGYILVNGADGIAEGECTLVVTPDSLTATLDGETIELEQP